MIVSANEYYLKRGEGVPYPEYWGMRRDPDGVLRDFMSHEEESQYVEDAATDLEFVRLLQPQAILDVGCGPGWFLDQLSGVDKCGTDICPTATEEAERRGIRVEKSCQAFKSESFDVVRCHHVIEHMEDPVGEIKEMYRVCKNWLLLSTPDFASPAAIKFGDQFRMLIDKTHVSLFTNESLHRFVRDHGFQVRQIAYPFPRRYATATTMHRWTQTDRISPPWPGSWLTLYCTKEHK